MLVKKGIFYSVFKLKNPFQVLRLQNGKFHREINSFDVRKMKTSTHLEKVQVSKFGPEIPDI